MHYPGPNHWHSAKIMPRIGNSQTCQDNHNGNNNTEENDNEDNKNNDNEEHNDNKDNDSEESNNEHNDNEENNNKDNDKTKTKERVKYWDVRAVSNSCDDV